jgi:ribonuclease HI
VLTGDGKATFSAKKRAFPADARDAEMIGRTIKTTGITVLRGDASRGSDWWVCRWSCGREFVAHGWGVRHGRVRNCGEHSEHVAECSQGKIRHKAKPEGPGMSAWFDGACEPFNPGGTATFGAVIKDKDGTVLSKEHGLVGRGDAMSNNVAEYAGVRQILRYLAPRPPGRVTIHGDSNLVINQLSGRWRIKKGLYLSIATETKELLTHLRELGWQISFTWIPREQNEECDALSKRIGVPPASIERFDTGSRINSATISALRKR